MTHHNDPLLGAIRTLSDAVAELSTAIKVQVNVSPTTTCQIEKPSRNLLTDSIQYSDFDSWKRNAIKLQNGQVFAPSNLYVLDGHNNLAAHFTRSEAVALEKEILRPVGWRLPTISEWRLANSSADSVNTLLSILHLKYEGWIPTPLTSIIAKDADVQGIMCGGSLGAYWSATQYDDCNTYCFMVDNEVRSANAFQNDNFGLSIRCIAI